MRVYIDCEFNGFGGELISMALVRDDGLEWYYGREEPRVWNEWVYENVFPVLGDVSFLGQGRFNAKLHLFLRGCDGCEFVADHPADFKHLTEQMDAISSRNNFVIPIECTMTLLRGSPAISSEVPHNALSDARALMKWHQGALAADELSRINQELGIE